MTTRRKNGQMSDKELEIRRFHKSVRSVKQWCADNDVVLHSYSEASSDELCVLSQDEYELSSRRGYLDKDNESYFVDEDDYEKASQHALYL